MFYEESNLGMDYFLKLNTSVASLQSFYRVCLVIKFNLLIHLMVYGTLWARWYLQNINQRSLAGEKGL
jgi:hypothetical protein